MLARLYVPLVKNVAFWIKLKDHISVETGMHLHNYLSQVSNHVETLFKGELKRRHKDDWISELTTWKQQLEDIARVLHKDQRLRVLRTEYESGSYRSLEKDDLVHLICSVFEDSAARSGFIDLVYGVFEEKDE